MTEHYKSYRIIDGKPRWVIVDETSKIVNRNPSKDELKGLKTEPRFFRDTIKKYTDRELLNYLIKFYEEYGIVPVAEDFNNNPGYPGFSTYVRRFGSWINSLKLATLDIDLIGHQGDKQRSRLAEIKVRDHFKNQPIDLAGENQNSPCDGICPNGMSYDVKSSKLHGNAYYNFHTNNKYKDKIQLYYLLGFNKDYTDFNYAWRIPGWNVVEKDFLTVGLGSNYEFNIENMKEYEITDKLKLMIVVDILY